jgi:hypothetical protein
METITLGRCFKGAWCDAVALIARRPLLLFAVYVLLFAVNVMVIQAASSQATAAAVGQAPKPGLQHFVQMSIIMVVQSLTFSLLVVQGIRYVVLGKDAVGVMGVLDKGFWRYLGLGWLFGLVIVMVTTIGVLLFVLTSMPASGSTWAIWSTFIALLGCAVLFVFSRSTLLFSHAALNRKADWPATWRASRGHFWSIFLTQWVVGLPFIIVGIVLGVIGIVLRHHASAEGFTIVLAALRTVIGELLVLVVGTTAGWLYRRYGAELEAGSN